MSVKPIIPSVDSNNNSNKFKINKVQNKPVYYTNNVNQQKAVSFQGAGAVNPIVGLMDFIDAGGYAASFILQDGLGFIAPRVGKGLVRGGKEKKDENGNPILDKDGKPKHELNWAYARKEALREVITGPSAFVIPMGMLSVINRYFGSGNNVKLNYLDSFQKPFTNYAKNNLDAIKAGNADKKAFYVEVLKDTIDKSINSGLSDADKMSPAEIHQVAEEYATRQMQIEQIRADKSLNKKAKAAKIAELGSVEDSFMKLKKSRVGGTVDELTVNITASNGKLKGGSIGELLRSMNDYFGDAVHNTQKALKKNVSVDKLEDAIKSFTNRRMGSRVLTNLGIFGVVAAVYTQIPKLYNAGLKGNPALEGAAAEVAAQEAKPEGETAKAETKDEAQAKDAKAAEKPANTVEEKKADAVESKASTDKPQGKDVNFTGLSTMLEKAGNGVLNNKHAKSISDIFELNGPIISGTAMTTLLYGFCIPPRLKHAQDKYDYGEIIVRDMTAFTALLFGAKALARLFSDGFTKITGLALNKKNMDGRNVFQKVIDYLSPNDNRHSVLSSKQLDSKYTHIDEYKNGVSGFMDFIEGSGGDVKKAFAQDKEVKATISEMLGSIGKTYDEASSKDIKNVLKIADQNKTDLMKKFYKLFEGDNGLLRKAKTCNSTFGFLSTLVLVPGLIIWLTDFCEKMTAKRSAKDLEAVKAKKQPAKAQKPQLNTIPSNTPSMAGFLKK